MTLVGWRRDKDYFERPNLVPLRDATRTGPNDVGKAQFGFDDVSLARTPPFKAMGEVYS